MMNETTNSLFPVSRISIDLPQRFLYSVDLSVRIGDINYGGHLGNDAVLTLLQEARLQFLKSLGFTEQNIDGLGIIMVDAAVLYKSESFHGDALRVDVAISDLHEYGCDVVYRVTNRDTGKEVVRAKTGIVFFDYGRRKIARVPALFAGRIGGGS